MTSIEFHSAQRQLRHRLISATAHAVVGIATRSAQAITAWHKRRRDRAAFMQLLGKEEWVYRDMGITRADAEWAAGLPKQVNAAKELERLRAFSMMGR